MKERICAYCKKELGLGWKWLGKPFYKQERAVCKDCYKDKQTQLKTKMEDL